MDYCDIELGRFSLNLPVVSGVKTHVKCESEVKYCFMEKAHDEISSVVELYQFTYAPVKKGEKLGRVLYICDGVMIGETEYQSRSTKESEMQYLDAISKTTE